MHTSAEQYVATTSQYGLLFEIGSYYKMYLRASDSSRLTGPSKNSPPSLLSEHRDHKGDFPGLFIKTEFSRVNTRASRLYRSGFLNTWHLLFPSPSGSLVWKADKVLIVPFLPSFLTEVGVLKWNHLLLKMPPWLLFTPGESLHWSPLINQSAPSSNIDAHMIHRRLSGAYNV